MNTTDAPPPIVPPIVAATSTAKPPTLVQHICFHAWKFGLMTQERERLLIENVSAQVTAWLNANIHTVEILHVATTQTSLGAYATVWFSLLNH